jgi:hypothetical protein
MQIRSLVASVAVSCALLCGAARACPVTYVFIGTVTEVGSSPTSTGTYGSIPIGTQVTGTYTFDRANVNANGNGASSISYGPVGSSTQSWEIGNGAGTDFGVAMPTGYAFSSNAQVGGFTYSTNSPDPLAKSYYATYSNGGDIGEPADFFAGEQQTDSNGRYTASSLYITNADGSAPFGRFGMPHLSTTSTARGEFQTAQDGASYTSYVDFQVTSLTPVTAPGRCVP